MVKSKDWAPLLARTVRWRYLVLDEGARAGLERRQRGRRGL